MSGAAKEPPAAAQWYAYCDAATGELRSTGSVRAAAVPAGMEEVALAQPADFSTQEWDAANKRMVAKPKRAKPFQAPMLLDRLTAQDVAAILTRLGLPAERAAELTADA